MSARIERMRVVWRHAIAQPGAATVLACALATILLLLGSWSCRLVDAGRTIVVEPALLPEPDIRVRIAAGERSVVISGPGEILVTDSAHNPQVMLAPLLVRLVGEVVEVEPASGRARRFGADEVLFRSGSPERLRVGLGAGLGLGPGGGPGVGEAAYPGALRLVVRDGGLDVINDVPVDDYLPGVIAKELYAGWPAETYRAQAIAARSYALHQRAFNAMRGRAHDIDAGEHAQVYAGHTESGAAHEAVRLTRGRVLTHDGEVIRAYYASTCGGRFASARDTWPTHSEFAFNLAPPLQAQHRPFACEGAPLYRWEAERSRAELSARLRSFAKDRGLPLRSVGRIESVEIAARNATGRPSAYGVRDDRGGVFEISPEHLRIACNYPVSGHKPVGEGRRVRSSDLELEVGDRVVVIRGRGFGHGVGMCQYCARGLAELGYDHERMLRAFYPGSEIEKAY